MQTQPWRIKEDEVMKVNLQISASKLYDLDFLNLFIYFFHTKRNLPLWDLFAFAYNINMYTHS
jgi:hypothetical protein